MPIKRKKVSFDTTLFPVIIRLLRTQSRQQWVTLMGGMACMIVVAGSTALMAHFMKPIIDDVFGSKNPVALYGVSVTVLFTFVAKSLASFGESVAMGKVGQRLIAGLQLQLFDHLLRVDYPFFQKHKTGTLVSRFINDVRMLENTMTQTINSLVKDILTVVALSGVMFYYDWKLAIFAVTVFPLAMIPVSRLGKRLRKTSHNVQIHVGELTNHLTQSFQGIRLVKAYNMYAYEGMRMKKIVEALLHKTLRAIRIKAMGHPIMEFLGGVAIVCVILYWGHQIIYYNQTPGEFFAFITALLMLYEPAKRIAKLQNQLQESMAAASRIFALLDYPQEQSLQVCSDKIPAPTGKLVFDNVTFSYGDGSPVLKDINLTIKKGDCIAFVGPSGGGKTTILNLLLGFFEVQEGRLLFDDRPASTYSLDALRRSIALVSQDVTLFDDTVAVNIGLGGCVPGVGDEETSVLPPHKDIESAAKKAAAHEFIMRLPNGYDTRVGERGARLSGGQRQRIALARALIRQSPIILLDEATSALDTVSERVIQESLEKLRGRRTVIIVAHRLSTVQQADQIVLIDKGRIVAVDTHTNLLQKSKLYQKLCRHELSEIS
ncbi:MAG: ABC transporter ATP-binding protein [Alphaproteobacteria bacterium]|nr:MAG: ABC transporter ATP-binding protein [Alphaproteobacteria bacterium]